jgi:hypothetical protein
MKKPVAVGARTERPRPGLAGKLAQMPKTGRTRLALTRRFFRT